MLWSGVDNLVDRFIASRTSTCVSTSAKFGPQDTTWASDGLIGDPSSDETAIALTPTVTDLGRGTLGLANTGISN